MLILAYQSLVGSVWLSQYFPSLSRQVYIIEDIHHSETNEEIYFFLFFYFNSNPAIKIRHYRASN